MSNIIIKKIIKLVKFRSGGLGYEGLYSNGSVNFFKLYEFGIQNNMLCAKFVHLSVFLISGFFVFFFGGWGGAGREVGEVKWTTTI